MTVTPPVYDCSIPVPRTLQSSYEYEIPAAGQTANRVMLYSFADYIAAPITGCQYTYSLETCAGSSVVQNRYNVTSNL